MALASENTRQFKGAARRRAAYDQRCAVARSPRDKIHALVWWWLAEINRLSPTRREAELARLRAITTELNEGGARHERDDCG